MSIKYHIKELKKGRVNQWKIISKYCCWKSHLFSLLPIMHDESVNITTDSSKIRTRSWPEITASILYSAAEYPITKTKIMSKAFISYDQTIKYLADLMGGDLIEAVEPFPPRHFRTTDKGFQFLKAYEMLQELTPVACRGNLSPKIVNLTSQWIM